MPVPGPSAEGRRSPRDVDTESLFPDLVGGLAVTPARTFTVTAPGLTRTGPAHWEAVRILTTDLHL